MFPNRVTTIELIQILDSLDMRNKGQLEEFSELYIDAVGYYPPDSAEANANSTILNLTQKQLTANQLARLLLFSRFANTYQLHTLNAINITLSKFDELMRRSGVDKESLDKAYREEGGKFIAAHKAQKQQQEELKIKDKQEQVGAYREILKPMVFAYIQNLEIRQEFKNELIANNEKVVNAILLEIHENHESLTGEGLKENLESKVRQHFESDDFGSDLSNSMVQQILDYKRASNVVLAIENFQSYLNETSLDVDKKQIKNNILNPMKKDLFNQTKNIDQRLKDFQSNFASHEGRLAQNLEGRVAKLFRIIKDALFNKPLTAKLLVDTKKNLKRSEKSATEEVKQAFRPKG